MDHPALTTPAATRGSGDLTIVRWREASLPLGFGALIAEAQASGIDWIGDFPDTWSARPFTAPGEALFLAFTGDRPVAMAVISADPFTSTPDVGRLRYIYVATAARGLGLLRTFVDLCLAHGAPRWRCLRLHTDNPVAARVYESYGFRPASDENRSTHIRGGC